jgi:hypothetical protein
MTLLGQRAHYWAGDYSSVIEFNPLARLLLQQHPAAFVAAAAASTLLVIAVVLRLPASLALVVSFVVTFGHVVAAASWCARLGAAGVVGVVVMLVAAERLFAFAQRKMDPAGAYL